MLGCPASPIIMLFTLTLAFVVSSCTSYMDYGMYGLGYNLGYSMMGPWGGIGHPGLMSAEENNQAPYLTCNNAEVLTDGSTVFAISASIYDKKRQQSKGLRGAKFNPLLPLGQMANNEGLSATIEVLNTAISGSGLVAFTTRSQPENGCALQGTAEFGSNLLPSEQQSPYGQGFGFGAMGMGLGNSIRYTDGVIAEIAIDAGRVSSLTIDGLPFKSLDELAGRGLVICTSVSSDVTGFPTCERPFHACCSLNYDRTDHSIDEKM